MNDDKSFLGRGWSFPPTFDSSSREIVMLDGEDDIKSSLEILLSTALGERVMQPKYGCNLSDLLFEPLTTTLQTELQNKIQVAILFFEPRIDVQKILLIPQNNVNGVLLISIDYIVRSTNSRGNLVYPFYLSEV